MRTFLSYLFLTGFLFVQGASAQLRHLEFSDALEKQCFEAWDTSGHQPAGYGLLESMLVAEGNLDSVKAEQSWIRQLDSTVVDSIGVNKPMEDKGRSLFDFLQRHVLRKFSTKATVLGLMTEGNFDCVTASALYYELGSKLKIPMLLHSTPYHVCPVIDSSGTRVWVEMTDPDSGFDEKYDSKAVIDLLLAEKLITPAEVAEKGDRATLDELVDGRFHSSPSALLAYDYYNHALTLDQAGEREKTFWDLEKAHFLAPEDETINVVLDASFREVSSLPRVPADYFSIARSYFETRGKDTLVASNGINSFGSAISSYVSNYGDVGPADSLMPLLRKVLPRSIVDSQQFLGLREYIYTTKSYELQRRGSYKQAYLIMRGLLENDPANGSIQDQYADAGISFADNLLLSGNDKACIAVLDTMRMNLPDYRRIKEVYAMDVVELVVTTSEYRTAPHKALLALIKAYKVDSSNVRVHMAIAMIYHYYAMEEVRRNNYQKARRYIASGLKYAPDDYELRSDLALIKKEENELKK